MMLHLARRVLPPVRCAKNACKLRTFLSRMHSDKASGRDVDDSGVGATSSFGTQRQAKVQLLELIKLTGDLQDRVMILNEAVSGGEEALPSDVRKVLVGLQKATEGVETVSERDENQRISKAFEENGIPFSTTDDISYLLWRDFNFVNKTIYIDPEGNIQDRPPQQFVLPVIKELIIRPPEETMTYSLYISNHFILLLEKDEGTGEISIATRCLYSSDGEFQPDTTTLNHNAWFIRHIERGQENFFIKSVEFQDTCIQAGTDTPLVAVTCTSGTCNRNLDSRNIGRLD